MLHYRVHVHVHVHVCVHIHARAHILVCTLQSNVHFACDVSGYNFVDNFIMEHVILLFVQCVHGQ